MYDEIIQNRPFPAKLTAVSLVSGTYLYDWTEQSFSPSTGAYTNADPARNGAAAESPALERNNRLVSVPWYVLMRYRGVVAGQTIFEFDASDSVSGDIVGSSIGTSTAFGVWACDAEVVGFASGTSTAFGITTDLGYQTITPAEPVTISTDQDDYVLPVQTFVPLNITSSSTFTGFAPPAPPTIPGTVYYIQNVGTATAYIANQNAGSTAGNRVATGTGTSLTLPPGSITPIIYSGATSRWVPFVAPSSAYPASMPLSVTLGSSQNNYDPGSATTVQINATTPINITGVVARPGGGKIRFVLDPASSPVTFVHNSGSSSAANRLRLSTAANLVVAAGGSLSLDYDDLDSVQVRWTDTSSAVQTVVAAAGGGGAGARSWLTYDITPATLSYAGTNRTFLLVALVPKQVICNVYLKHSVPFSGGSVSALLLSVGIGLAGTPPTPTGMNYVANADLYQPAADNVYWYEVVTSPGSSGSMPAWEVARVLMIEATSFGDDLDQLTDGAAEIRIETMIVP